MMNHLTSIYENRLGQLAICPYIYAGLLDGVLNHFAERWWGTKNFFYVQDGVWNFSNCAKLSSALVPRIKNDHSLIYENVPPLGEGETQRG